MPVEEYQYSLTVLEHQGLLCQTGQFQGPIETSECICIANKDELVLFSLD